MFAQEIVPAVKPLPKIEEARTESDFKRIELKMTQANLFIATAMLFMTFMGIQRGRR